MKIEPSLRFCSFEELSSGDLFIYVHDNGSCVALKVEDPDQNGQKLVLPFGPAFPRPYDGPNLLRCGGMNVVAFGKDYVLRLPVHPEGWSQLEPAENVLCLLLAERTCFLRANFLPIPNQFAPCYIELCTGLVQVDEQNFRGVYKRPMDLRMVAIEWELMSTELKPRVIFAQPSPLATRN